MIEALKAAPSTTVVYNPIKYGSLQLNESTVGIKCSQSIEIKWKWDNDIAIIEHVTIYDRRGNIVSEGLPNISTDRMHVWLEKNTNVQSVYRLS